VTRWIKQNAYARQREADAAGEREISKPSSCPLQANDIQTLADES
jgi:hypothetical protein